MLMAFKIAAATLLVAIGAVLAYAATQPDTFQVRRSVSVNAPPERIFPLIDDFRQWSLWSPYEKRDPAMRKTFGDASSGKGAVYNWAGNSDVGSGRITIVDTTPPSEVRIKLDMLEPFEAHNDVTFTLAPQGAATQVTWHMQGPVPYLAKIVHVFMDMDKMVGSDFEAGLSNLKAVAEK